MSTNFVSVGPGVGSHAPDLVLSGVEQRPTHGEPRVLAFARDWTPASERPELIAAIRAQLRGLGAELLGLSDGAAWSVRADDPVELLGAATEQLAGDVATAAMLYGVREGAGAVFVIDGRGVVRFAYRPAQPPRSVCQALADALAIAVAAMHDRATHDTRHRVLFTRREWTVTCLVVGCAATFLHGCKEQPRPPAERAAAPAEAGPAELDVALRINGKARAVKIDPRASLLDVLREQLGLTGTKKGCDAGQCGACTVLAGGKRITACLTLAAMAQGKDITTIEGLATGGALHPMQQAFVDHDGLQCGYCTPGQILSAVALLGEGHATTDAEVREQMSGNICRCGAYPNIVAAIQAARRARG